MDPMGYMIVYVYVAKSLGHSAYHLQLCVLRMCFFVCQNLPMTRRNIFIRKTFLGIFISIWTPQKTTGSSFQPPGMFRVPTCHRDHVRSHHIIYIYSHPGVDRIWNFRMNTHYNGNLFEHSILSLLSLLQDDNLYIYNHLYIYIAYLVVTSPP